MFLRVTGPAMGMMMIVDWYMVCCSLDDGGESQARPVDYSCDHVCEQAWPCEIDEFPEYLTRNYRRKGTTLRGEFEWIENPGVGALIGIPVSCYEAEWAE